MITSRKNEHIKELKKLERRRGRDEAGCFMAEGVKCVREALKSGFTVREVLLSDESLIKDLSADPGIVTAVTDEVIEALSDAKTPQGVVAVVEKKESAPVFSGLTVVLDDVSDPTNVGSIIRSADAAGASCVILSEGCADAFGPKSVRCSMGSVFHIPVVTADIKEYLSEFGKNGSCVCGHLKGDSVFPEDNDICVVIGNESRGVSGDTADLCGYKYRIPIYGRAESLNAGVAAGLMLYKAAESIRSYNL